MKHAHFLLLFFSFISIKSQNKTQIFIDQNGNEISIEQLNKLDLNKYNIKEAENDSIRIIRLYYNKKKQKLDSIEHSQINTFLYKIVSDKYNSSKKTMIHYYRKSNDKILYDSKYEKY